MKLLRWVLLSELVFIVYAVVYFHTYNHLPAPFYPNPNDSFMDLYHTVFWSVRDGRYDNWRSIYPAFAFLLAQVTSSGSCLDISSTPSQLRSCDQQSIVWLCAGLLVSSICCAIYIIRTSPYNYHRGKKVIAVTFCAVAILCSTPVLFAFERGNYIIYAFLALVFSLLSYGTVMSGLALGFAISLKQYLVVLLFPEFLYKRNAALYSAIFAVLVLQIISIDMLEEKHGELVLTNMFFFAGNPQISLSDKLWFPTSVDSYIKVLNSDLVLYSFNRSFLQFSKLLILTYSYLCKLLLVLGLICLTLRRKSIDFARVYVLVGLLVCSDSIGGYGYLLILPFASTIYAHVQSKTLLTVLFITLLAFEIPLYPIAECKGISFLSGLACVDNFRVSAWSYLRVLAINWLFLYFTIKLIYECIFEKRFICLEKNI